ncbi:hypothetical protein [Acinetobacter sp.]|uniref:hypothetical protein n=1 Tax=Acinetobacter sp. TaxID=472 RepID=UPI00388F2938
MITFKQFLNETGTAAGRTKPVSAEELIAWAEKNARRYLSGTNFLYRGGSGIGAPILLGNSVSIKPRRSANTNNNYTLWLDNNPAFKGYPKRSQAFIGTDDKHTAAGFGNPSLLIIADNAKVGFVGHQDLWFVEVDPKTHMTIEEWNGNMEFALQKISLGRANTYEELVTSLKAATLAKLEDAKDNESNESDEQTLEKVITSIYKNGCKTMFELWEKLFTPHLFPPMTTGSEASQEAAFGEVWIEGEVAFITASGHGVSAEDHEAIMKWSMENKYPHFFEKLSSDWDDKEFNDEL